MKRRFYLWSLKRKNVDDLPLSHFVNLANKKGLSKITKALNNLQVWNKNDDPKLSKWAGNMIDKLNKKLGKDESAMKIRINESEMPYVLWVLDGNDNTWKMYKGINNAKTFINNNDYDEFLNALNTQVYPNKTYKNNYIDWIVIPAGEDPKTFNVDSFYDKIEKESLTKKPNKSYWKFNQFESDNYEYYDKQSVRKFNLIPCETEDDCFIDENDNYSAWPVYDISDGDSTKPVYCTKREAYNYLLDLLNQSTYEREHDI